MNHIATDRMFTVQLTERELDLLIEHLRRPSMVYLACSELDRLALKTALEEMRQSKDREQ